MNHISKIIIIIIIIKIKKKGRSERTVGAWTEIEGENFIYFYFFLRFFLIFMKIGS